MVDSERNLKGAKPTDTEPSSSCPILSLADQLRIIAGRTCDDSSIGGIWCR